MCQISRSQVILFENYCPYIHIKAHTRQTDYSIRASKVIGKTHPNRRKRCQENNALESLNLTYPVGLAMTHGGGQVVLWCRGMQCMNNVTPINRTCDLLWYHSSTM